MREDLIIQLQNYKSFNDQESYDKEVILSALKNTGDIFYRTNAIAHMTASGWIVNQKRTKVLMAYHNIYNSWAWLGGHADGNEDLLSVALREVKEESGLENVIVLSPDIFSLEILPVNGHEKNGKYVSSHLHFNITYLFEASEKSHVSAKLDENSKVEWFYQNDVCKASTEKWFCERIYPKLNEKVSFLKY